MGEENKKKKKHFQEVSAANILRQRGFLESFCDVFETRECIRSDRQLGQRNVRGYSSDTDDSNLSDPRLTFIT